MLLKATEHLFKNRATYLYVRRTIQAIHLVWSHLKVFWLSKDNSTGHSESKKKEEEEVARTRMHFVSSTSAAQDRTRWQEIIVKSSVSPERPRKVN